MYVICEIKGKQYKLEKDKEYRVDLLHVEQDSVVEFDKVMLVRKDDGEILVGKPYVENVKVKAKVVIPEFKDKKVIAFKYKRRKGYKRKVGHRQRYSVIKIEEINL